MSLLSIPAELDTVYLVVITEGGTAQNNYEPVILYLYNMVNVMILSYSTYNT